MNEENEDRVWELVNIKENCSVNLSAGAQTARSKPGRRELTPDISFH